jgi:molecular chaperone GrpE
MKKKTHSQKNFNQKYSDKTADNKENTYTQVNNYHNREGIPPSGGSSESTSEVTNKEVPVADIVSPEAGATDDKLAEMQDKYMRLSAEFDNYRKRTLREKMELSKYAGENMLLSIIPLMDDFERALKHMETGTDFISLKSGIDLIYNKFGEFLKQNGVKEIESLNKIFNVDLHEAVAKVHVQEDDKKGKVVDVLQKGYYLQDKVLRFSKVVVGE